MARKKTVQTVVNKKQNEYELVYIISPEITDEALENRVNSVSQFITGHEGVISSVDKWGKRKLAYPLKHQMEGNYILTRFNMSPNHCKELESSLKISEEILRHLLIKVSS